MPQMVLHIHDVCKEYFQMAYVFRLFNSMQVIALTSANALVDHVHGQQTTFAKQK